MAPDRNKLLCFGAAASLRLLLILLFPSLSHFLIHRVEISTPITSFKRLQEGLYLYNHNVSPYSGGVYHQAPILLPLFSILPQYQTSPLWTTLIYIIADLISANALVRIADSAESRITRLFTSPRKDYKYSSTFVAAAFLFNPFTVLSCIAYPTNIFTTCALLEAIATAVEGKIVNSIFALAIATYLSMYPILLTPALALLAYDRTSRLSKAPPSKVSFFGTYFLGLLGSFAALMYLSYLIMGSSWDFIAATYGFHLEVPDLTPNIGLWWYFFIEMFDSFRDFFLGVFWLHMASYVPGLTIRFRAQPLFVIMSLLGIFAVFKPYPSIADASLYLSMFPLYRHLFPLLRYSFIATAALLYASFLGPAFYHLWIYAGSGNANFFYAITLVWSLGLTIIVADFIWAAMRDEFDVERPELMGKEVKRI